MGFFEAILELIKSNTGTTSDGIAIAMLVVGFLIVIFGFVGVGISIVLFFRYFRLNRTKNSCGLTGEQVARKILDDNGLENIKVKCTGSLIWGNSYSHFFHKVRLRRLIHKKKSITALAMASQKSALAIMDKENDPIMKTRNTLIPLQLFGPLMFLPLIVVGVVIDFVLAFINGTEPSFIGTFIAAGLGVAFYVVSFALTAVILKAETKAQARSIEILREDGLATEEEIENIRDLYKIYNLEYINNMILAFLELILRVLQIIASAQGSSSRSSNN
ncbi:zinc metallopeptidase [bacterium]|nr:zinc metallopeptidase [bacterium]